MKISNLSLVIIAHNEQFALQKCLSSIVALKLIDCEIICVDSGSTDNTLEAAKSFITTLQNYKILHIDGYQNASIARNAGLAHASKKYIIFIDGDIELNIDFLQAAIVKLENDGADAVFGMLIDYEYDDNYAKITRVLENRTAITKEEKRYLCGGIFMLKKSVVDDIGVFDENFIKCEDFDYTLRLTKNHTLIAIPIPMGIHHTVPYTNKGRMKNEIKNNLAVYYGAVMRKNHDNYKGCLAYINKAGYIKGLFVLALIIAGLKWVALAYLGVALLLLDVILGIKKNQNIKFRLLSHYQMPILVFWGLVRGVKKIGDIKNRVSVIHPKNNH